MADIELVIKIDEKVYEARKKKVCMLDEADIAIANGTPLPKGYWVKKSQYGNDYCSKCDYELLMCGKPKYCPNCGAKMIKPKEED